MPIRKIQFTRGHYYHLYNRGANRQSIFYDEQDYRDFLTRLKKHVLKFQITVIAYCLMPNHFHFFLRQDGEVKVGLPLQLACNGYVQHFNLRHQRTGTLFAGRFRALPVEGDEYLRSLCCYIHGNPVKDGFALQPELWLYSNYLEWIGQREGKLVDQGFIADHFGTQKRYQQIMADYLTHSLKIPPQSRIYLAGLDE